jgi:hypothetical protein
MDFTYAEHDEWSFPHWFDLERKPSNDDLVGLMDVSQWCGENFGPVGESWGYERKVVTHPHEQGLNPVRVKLHYTTIQYSWRFKNKEDAMMFKLRWFGA